MFAPTSGGVLVGRTIAERVRGSFLFLLSVHTERRKYLNINSRKKIKQHKTTKDNIQQKGTYNYHVIGHEWVRMIIRMYPITHRRCNKPSAQGNALGNGKETIAP